MAWNTVARRAARTAAACVVVRGRWVGKMLWFQPAFLSACLSARYDESMHVCSSVSDGWVRA